MVLKYSILTLLMTQMLIYFYFPIVSYSAVIGSFSVLGIIIPTKSQKIKPV